MFQFVITPETAITVEAPGLQADLLTGWLVIAALVLLGLVFLFFLIRFIVRKTTASKTAFDKIVLSVKVPKEAAEKKEEGKGGSVTQEIQEHLSAAENLFAAIGGLKAEKGWQSYFFGYKETFSFEIVADSGLISFYIAVPRKRREIFEQQIHAQYPYAHIEEVPDYNMFDPQGVIFSANLVFRKPSFFPIKVYKKAEGDPMEGILGPLAKIDKLDGIAVQIVARSASPNWRRRGLRIVSEMRKGKSLKESLKSGDWLGQLTSLIPESKKKKDEKKEPRSLSPIEQETQKAIEEKATKAGLEVNIRIVASAKSQEQAKLYIDNIVAGFAAYNVYEYGNVFTRRNLTSKARAIRKFIFRDFDSKQKFVLNAEEMASVWHLPLPETDVPNINWLGSRQASPPANMPKEGLIVGKVIFRGAETTARLKEDDRRRHTYIIGKSGVGKSKLIAYMARQDIAAGKGICVLDPHGELIDDILEGIPKDRIDDVIYFDPSDTDRPIGLNMLEVKSEEQRDMAVAEMIAIFYKLFPPEMIGPMFEHTMRNVMLTLMSDPNEAGTIAEIPRLITDPEYQKYWIAKVTDVVVRAYWEKEVAKTSDFHKSEMFGYLISKVGRFVENSLMRNIIGQVSIRGGKRIGGFDLREVMDKKKILLINLSKGKIGDINAQLLGLIIVSKLQMAALSRADMPEGERQDFYLYMDEFQNFITDSIAVILSEARKYRLNLIMAHQYMGQLTSAAVVGRDGDTRVRDAVLGNAGTMVIFRIGVEDAEFLEKEFAPTFNKFDLINLDKGTAYVRLLIDNTASRPFAIKTVFLEHGDRRRAEAIKQLSRLRYGRDKAIVEAEILERSRLGEAGKVSGPFAETKK